MNNIFLEKLVEKVIREKKLDYSKYGYSLYLRCERLNISLEYRVEEELEKMMDDDE